MFSEIVSYVKELFTKPSAEVIAMRELEDAKRELLKAQTAREYADSMCKYHEARIKRLKGYMQSVSMGVL